ncbi:glycosyltransferase involved in cell wall biosynthesis [Nocardioides cavernae]|uniref:Glycosyltransferase involved in cell wall biosynthesis n=1 Tax=Nocardioides cavernae TaxID=1921566 RepID=A0A7Y9H054_9ACTN|nr:glycosyltransferase [Nocardioides cavernae]NYE35526.1 glycosyltransferase involved in cell wall biosynthesis [Nocardioides cavernae]
MSRVLLVSHEASRTGAPRIAVMVGHALVEQGHDVRIVSQRPGPLVEDFAAVAPTRVPPMWRVLRRLWSEPGPVRSSLAKLVELATALAVVAVHRPDIVYVNSTSSAAYVRAAAALRRPAVLHVHESGRVLRGFLDRVGFHGLPRGRVRLVACSPSVVDALVALGAPRGDIELLLSIPDARRVLAAATRSTPSDMPRPVVVGCVGAVEYRKGVDLWVGAARRLLAEHDTEELRFVWVGGGVPPDGLPEGVEFAGHSANPSTAMAGFDIMTLPSRDDPFPLVVMEAMLLGKPVVAFDVGGVRRQLGDTGVLVPAGDIDAFAREIDALAGDPDRRARLGGLAAERARAQFSVEQFEADLAEVIARV